MDYKKLLTRRQEKDTYDGFEKREFARLAYPSSQRPTLKVKEHELEVFDISEGGLKFLNYMQIKFGKKISGTVKFLSGKSIDINGKIVRQHNNEIGLLITPISEAILIEEIRTLIRDHN